VRSGSNCFALAAVNVTSFSFSDDYFLGGITGLPAPTSSTLTFFRVKVVDVASQLANRKRMKVEEYI
jgi:hypothetical protein